ncbi:endogenous retrovirus group K member 7 Gag polyprotein [Anomalospiza imberbis]|uniref:endogenous retrovirus group K member 7 Gag polyprotein n=1 Tax=Anomalospiza imberbis TaxID=187417 RepID=UPI00358F019F
MGSKFSTTQKGVYYEILGILAGGNVSFSKGKLKQFIRWLFLHFPQVSPEDVRSTQFWDTVGRELVKIGKSGNTSTAKFVFWSLQIRSALPKQREVKEKPNSNDCASALPIPPHPNSQPCTPKLRILKGTESAHAQAAGLPEHFKMSETPCPRGSGQTEWNSPPTLVSPAQKPRARVGFSESSDFKYGSQSPESPQNGGCHMAISPTWSSPSHDPPWHPKNPFLPITPANPRDTFPPPTLSVTPSAPPPYPPQGASTDVMSPGVPAHCSHSVPAPRSHGLPAPSLGSHGGNTPIACPCTPTGDPNACNSNHREQGTADPIQGPLFSLAPVTYQQAGQAGGATTANWRNFALPIIKEICKIHNQYGSHSPYFRGLLNAELSRAVVVPYDLKQLFACLMTTTEFKLWEITWKQLLKEALPALHVDPKTAKDVNGLPITIEHLSGEGQWSLAPVQAATIPVEVLERVKEAAEKAFFTLQLDGPLEPYSKIKQLPSEPFSKFVERLTRAIEVQVRKENAREEVLEEMALANANEQCRTAILSLPLDPPPTLNDMLLVCSRKVPLMSVAEDTRPKPLPRPPQRVAVASPAPVPSAQRHTGQQRRPAMVDPTKPCMLCRNLGHWAHQCPLKRQFDEFVNSRERELQALPEGQQQQKN